MEKTIEIPLGAKDSELKGWEYTIPEGMEAIIKDGKIIVREKESEDEKIRKELLAHVQQERASSTLKVNHAKWDKMIAWLEKQGEQKKKQYQIYESTKDRFYKEGVEDGILISKKQNPAWSEEDESWFKELELMALSFSDDESYRKKFFDWLKALKSRVQPQPKSEWSEKNEAVLDALIRRLEGEDIYVSPHLAVECLKFLKERYTWKPSDEQMEYLAKAITTLGNEGDNKTSAILSELRTDLKKLKG